MRPSLALIAVASSFIGLTVAGRAGAQGVPEAGRVSAIADAEQELAQGQKELEASGGTCVTMCKALQSMMRAADRICDLAKGGADGDQQRCSDARSKVAEAAARVRAACPDCNPAPPLAPSTTPPTEPGKAPMTKGEEPHPAPMMAGDLSLESRVTSAREGRTLTVTFDPLRLLAPPADFLLRFERGFGRRASIGIVAGYGSIRKVGSEGRGHVGGTTLGAEARVYVAGAFDATGLFLGAEFVHRSAVLTEDEHLDARYFVPGITVGPVVGLKAVFPGGLTLETRAGASVVVDDQRPPTQPRDKVVPTFGVGLGWSF